MNEITGLKKCKLPDKISGTRITLSKLDVYNAELIFHEIDSDRERLGMFLPWVNFMNNVEDERSYILTALRDWQEGSEFNYSIFDNAHDDFIGNIGVHTISWENRRAELGYWLVAKYEGKGYISEAVLLLEKQLFSLGFHRIEIRCSSQNARSSKVPQRCGYHFEGTLRSEKIERGEFRDTLVFSKLSK